MTRATPGNMHVSVRRALKADERPLAPARAAIVRWARAAQRVPEIEVSFRLVSEDEGRALNHAFRQRDYATNVLTFVYDDAPPLPAEAGALPLMGDIALCVPVIIREAEAQGKALDAHFAHLVVHGMLHLQGYDHEEPAQAEAMEALETAILARLGYPDPYASEW